MSAYVILDIDVTNPEGYKEYIRLAPAAVTHYGGRYLARGGRVEVLEGDQEPGGRTIVIEFPTFEDAQRWYSSPEYCTAKGVRQSCARADLVIVDGV